MVARTVSSLVPLYSPRGYEFAPYAAARNWIGGEWRNASTGETMDVENPRYGRPMGKVVVSPGADVDVAVRAAKAALPKWRHVPLRERAQVMYRLKSILERDMEEMCWLLSAENGKTYVEAQGDVGKAIECVEFAAALAMSAAGGQIDVSRGVNCRLTHEPLGIVAGITPFNFPVMVPLWMIPNALMGGNAFILKPSSLVPYGGMRLAAAIEEAGLPEGIFNVVYGRRDAVSAIVDHPEISAVGFVGSTPVAKHLYGRGATLGKRMLCLGSAKNHAIVVPDADLELTATTLVASAYGCAGQRCMAATIMVAVGDVQPIIDEMVVLMRKLELGKDMGPIITKEDAKRIVGYIDQAESMGAKILADGRGAKVAGCPGNWVGPTLIDHVTPEMPASHEEIFGPVFCIMHAKTLDEAIDLANSSPYGNGGAVFTQSGEVARHVAERLDVGMFGVNIGIPVPREPFAFGGWKDSGFGCLDITGMDGFHFWTRAKKTTEKWAHQTGGSWMS
ncbi:MAG: CoA-acylating methylmalonate-semialdehyde dehydrogenase [Deltaproteobacteria bacterium]|nr:CoA-acylating methylmalonate-semialdehyde dehydrogenase [Deltaproteobacteria bacterium]